MKGKNRYATNEGGIIKAPNKPKQPKSTVIKGKDLRDGKK